MGSPVRLRVEVLGPLRVEDSEGVDVTPAGVLQRRLLSFLVLRRGRTVSADAAIDALWGPAPPREPAGALQNQVSRLRRTLPTATIQSAAGGYRLDPTMVDVDVDRLELLLGERPGEGGRDEELAAMLTRWHGPAFLDLEDNDEGRLETARLEELRVRAREAVAAGRLARGESVEAIVDLTALVASEPLRERPAALLMDALSAAGRTAEALRVYDDFRRRLGDELGIDPSPMLAARHAELLSGAPQVGVKRPWAARLPVPVTSLVGREPLIAGLVHAAGSSRLVTLVGPGGVGKTRLLLEVGRRLSNDRPDRPVVLCELAEADARSPVEVVAASLGIDPRPGTSTQERILDVIGDSELALLVDNCEHVIEEIAVVVERLLGSCPGVVVLATSRERLRGPGETVWTVPTLLGTDGESAAVELFVQRARAVRIDFDPDPTERALIGDIVRRLDGLPLAIELAAARLHTHDLEEVAAGLDERFSLLSDGSRSSARHSSLSAAVSWSFGLLDAPLQEVLEAVSVFSAPFGALDASGVCALTPSAARTALGQLVERSLVTRPSPRRFRLLETVRAFAVERLEASGRVDLVRERHARRMLELAEDAARRLHVPGEPVLTEIDDMVGELRAALDWLLGHGLVDLAARLVAALVNYGVVRLRPDVLAWAEQVAAVDPERRGPHSSQILAAQAYAAWMAGDIARAAELAQDAVTVAERVGPTIPAVSATIRGNIELFDGRLGDAAAWYRRAVASASDDPGQRLVSAGALLLALGYASDEAAVQLADDLLAEVGTSDSAVSAYVWYCAGEADMSFDRDRARARFAQALALAERTNGAFARGVAGASLASIDAVTGDPEAVAADYRWLIGHWRRAGMWSTQWTMLRSIAALLARLGRYDDAAVLEGAVRATRSGHRIFGVDEAALGELSVQLRAALGDEAYEAALQRGSRLDGEAAVEHALRSL